MTKDEALKMALEALIGARAFLESDAPVEIWRVNDKAITAIKDCLNREALAQPEPTNIERHEANVQKFLNAPQPEQEPVMRVKVEDGCWMNTVSQNLHRLANGEHDLYAAPPQRTWVGLTEEEAKKIQTIMIYGNWSFQKIIETIEAKLKERNDHSI